MNTYPEWQKQMREDQAASVAKQKAEQEALEEIARNEAFTQSEKTAQFLESLGLPAGFQMGTGRKLDSFRFDYRQDRDLSVQRIPDESEAHMFDEMDDLPWRVLSITPSLFDATSMRVQIANTLDILEEEYRREVVRFTKRAAAIIRAQANPIKMQSDAEQIYDLIYKINEIMQRNVNRDAF